MSDPLTAISNALNTDLKRLETISHNITNANTHGFKAMQLVPVDNSSMFPGSIPDVHSLTNKLSTGDGTLQSTGRSLDFAISGSAFFSVMTPDGIAYVRNGSLSLNARGELITAAGHRLLGESGSITVQDNSFRVTEDGAIEVDGLTVDRLRLASPRDGTEVTRATDGTFRFGEGMLSRDAKVHQGMLETSNVDVTAEMVRLIETSRHMESVQRAMRIYDQMLDTGINQIGKGR